MEELAKKITTFLEKNKTGWKKHSKYIITNTVKQQGLILRYNRESYGATLYNGARFMKRWDYPSGEEMVERIKIALKEIE